MSKWLITGVELLTTRPRFRSFFSIHTNSDVTCSYSNKVRGLCRLLIPRDVGPQLWPLCLHTRACFKKREERWQDGAHASSNIDQSSPFFFFFFFSFLVFSSSVFSAHFNLVTRLHARCERDREFPRFAPTASLIRKERRRREERKKKLADNTAPPAYLRWCWWGACWSRFPYSV